MFMLHITCRELKDKVAEADAACGLGAVYQQMGEYSTALRYHQADLDTAEELGLAVLQGRACGNLGTVHESLGHFEEAVRYQEQHLSVAAQTNDKLAKTMAYSSLGMYCYVQYVPIQPCTYGKHNWPFHTPCEQKCEPHVKKTLPLMFSCSCYMICTGEGLGN
jgi:tetratricopeptide (TPR) repeat protein